eukprot:TRINITY_DN45960_c0_g1_i1.p1 TRINITY_DN45960_c0_g1~~TRINITY_DN45960_c0_g1_i1.p1  ORF type:complete len:119 (+),score=14.51 TRINITY_DN45960_c0_g1_i1:222-578(+)
MTRRAALVIDHEHFRTTTRQMAVPRTDYDQLCKRLERYLSKLKGESVKISEKWAFDSKLEPGKFGSGIEQAKQTRSRLAAHQAMEDCGFHVVTLNSKQQIGRAVQQECRDRSRMPSSA